MLFTELSWKIGRAGAHLIAAPRATGGHRRWRAAASLMAIVSGCFVASANRRSYEDRKSTRLNSSHLVISYAVFCFKKKKRRGIASVQVCACHYVNEWCEDRVS